MDRGDSTTSVSNHTCAERFKLLPNIWRLDGDEMEDCIAAFCKKTSRLSNSDSTDRSNKTVCCFRPIIYCINSPYTEALRSARNVACLTPSDILMRGSGDHQPAGRSGP